MKKVVIIVISLIISLGLIYFIVTNIKVQDKGDKINTINNEVNNKTINITKSNQISQYMPENIKEINLINYMSDKNNPTTYVVNEINKVEEFIDLLFKTDWQEVDKSQKSDMEDCFWKITIIGDTNFILEAKGIGGANSDFGILTTEIENNEKVYFISKNIYSELLSFTDEKYYLHESDLEVPSQEKCYIAQEKALSNLTEEEKKSIQKEIRENHIYMEYQLLDAVRLIKDKNSPYWESFTEYGVFTDPYTGTKVDSGGGILLVLDNIKKVKEKINNEETKRAIQEFCDTLEEGMKEHSLKKCFEAHKVLHDYDYWVINTPVHLEYSPADWGGVTTYFGKASI